MSEQNEQFKVVDGIIEIPLSGAKLPQETKNLEVINNYGSQLYEHNKGFIREKVPDNWFAVIEPTTGKLIASDSPVKLYQYTTQNYSGKLMFVIGLLREQAVSYVRRCQ